MSNKEYKPTLAQLRTFVTIAEHKHFGTAASKLHISQPSLSQALAALESGLDIQLIERSTRKVIVTPAGKELLPFAKARWKRPTPLPPTPRARTARYAAH